MQLVDGIELDQQSVISHALVRQASRRQKGLAEREQWLEERAALAFLTQLAITGVLWLVLEQADPVHPLAGLEKCL